MDTNAESRLLGLSPRAVLAGLVAVPVYVIPVGLWGVKALYPRVLRDVARGAIAMGVVSLVAFGLRGLSRSLSASAPAPLPQRKRSFEGFQQLIPDEVAASAASAH